jgi:hypothetical protein
MFDLLKKDPIKHKYFIIILIIIIINSGAHMSYSIGYNDMDLWNNTNLNIGTSDETIFINFSSVLGPIEQKDITQYKQNGTRLLLSDGPEKIHFGASPYLNETWPNLVCWQDKVDLTGEQCFVKRHRLYIWHEMSNLLNQSLKSVAVAVTIENLSKNNDLKVYCLRNAIAHNLKEPETVMNTINSLKWDVNQFDINKEVLIVNPKTVGSINREIIDLSASESYGGYIEFIVVGKVEYIIRDVVTTTTNFVTDITDEPVQKSLFATNGATAYNRGSWCTSRLILTDTLNISLVGDYHYLIGKKEGHKFNISESYYSEQALGNPGNFGVNQCVNLILDNNSYTSKIASLHIIARNTGDRYQGALKYNNMTKGIKQIKWDDTLLPNATESFLGTVTIPARSKVPVYFEVANGGASSLPVGLLVRVK